MIDNKSIAGLLLFAGAAQFVFAIIICEATYFGYNVGQQAMIDSGNWGLAGSSAEIFDGSVFLIGIFVIAGAYFIRKRKYSKTNFSPIAIYDRG